VPEPGPRPDPLSRVLEAGLAAVVVAAPLPFGAVSPAGRLALEVAALSLLAIWIVRALALPTPLPPRLAALGLAGLVLLGALQCLPVGAAVTSVLSPLSLETRRASQPEGAALEAERRILSVDPALLEGKATLSLDPQATASALRTGAALVALLIVATSVVATRGPVVVCLALLVAAAFQALYGTLVLASGHPVIWHVPKTYYLDCATGTFVNRNHFAGFLAAALPPGLALAVWSARELPVAPRWRERLLAAASPAGIRTAFLGLLVATGIAGLLLSYSRAGIALGIGALLLTALCLGGRGWSRPVLGVVLAAVVGALPLAQIGAERLAARYARAGDDFASPAGRSAVWHDTLGMIRAAPLFGVGFGAFDAAYPIFRSPEVRLHYDHAHNDPLQALAEGGLAAGVLLALVLAPLLREIVRALGRGRGTLAVGLAAGAAALLLHGLIDFNFHIPANAATGAILAGTLLGLRWNEEAT